MFTLGKKNIFLIIFVSCGSVYAQGRFSELTFLLERPESISHSRKGSKILLNLPHNSKLQALESYDERTIQRVLIHERSSGVQLSIFLQDSQLRYTVDHYTSPSRIVLSIFDRFFSPDRDPHSGLPKAHFLADDDTDKMLAVEHPVGMHVPVEAEVEPERESKYRLQSPGKVPLLNFQSKSPVGRGPAWQQYPYYIYPLLIAPYEGREQSTKADSSYAVADYGLRMFRLGNEQRALDAYQQVLHSMPSLFNRDILHLWALAESQLGQGNLTLADGYYEALVKVYPGDPLSNFSQIRRLDLKSIPAIKDRDLKVFAKLKEKLVSLHERKHPEFKAQILIRQAYWQNPILKDFVQEVPSTQATAEVKELLRLGLENRKTHLLLQGIMLQSLLKKEGYWSTYLAAVAGEFFKAYDKARPPFYSQLRHNFDQRLASKLRQGSELGQHAATIAIYRQLPSLLQEVKNLAGVSWALAESQRHLGALEEALPFYVNSLQSAMTPSEKFKVNFWLASIQSELGQAKYRKAAVTADKRLQASWLSMQSREQDLIRQAYRPHLESTLQLKPLLKTPLKIILSSWTSSLSKSEVEGEGEAPSSWQQAFTASPETIFIIDLLIKHFRALGMRSERQQAANLLKKIDIGLFVDDKQAQQLWQKHLLALVEEYRQDKQYLDAGELYSWMASNNPKLLGRAEAFYKGGLLLYRAGQREQAIRSLEAASKASDNLFYTNLAKERLVQLSPQ